MVRRRTTAAKPSATVEWKSGTMARFSNREIGPGGPLGARRSARVAMLLSAQASSRRVLLGSVLCNGTSERFPLPYHRASGKGLSDGFHPRCARSLLVPAVRASITVSLGGHLVPAAYRSRFSILGERCPRTIARPLAWGYLQGLRQFPGTPPLFAPRPWDLGAGYGPSVRRAVRNGIARRPGADNHYRLCSVPDLPPGVVLLSRALG
jgi:hypothetical protein